MKQNESDLSRKIRLALNARGHWVHKNHGSAFSYRGLFDISGGSRDNRPIWLEVKLIGKERSGLSAGQVAFARESIKRCPCGIIAVVSSVADAIWAVEGKGLFPSFVDGVIAQMVRFSELSNDEQARVLHYMPNAITD